ncbi:uncharacterized protein JCM6883_000212 [Sporobolomyces salmoneus]|uniref:uncharacterized protein n=1 Tax=Sporobolomyces salmoneus TaxID=183962 RepID=UPI003182A989
MADSMDPAADFLDRVIEGGDDRHNAHRSSRSSHSHSHSHSDRDHRDHRDRDYRGGGSHRERSRSPRHRSSRGDGDSGSRRDRDREYERRRDNERSSGEYDDRRRGGDDYKSSRRGYDDYEDRGGRRREDYGRRGGYDDRGPPPRGHGGGGGYRDDRRGPPGGGRGGGGGRGRPTFEGFADQGDRHRRSPTPEDTIPISKRTRPFTAWDVKPNGFETFTSEQAKLTGMFNLPGQNRPYLPAGFDPASVQTADGQNPPIFFRPPVFGAVGPGAPIGSLARQSRRLYVGNITMEATEETIAQFFNSKMVEMGLVSDGHLGEDLQGLGLKGDTPVISVHVNYEKNYAFVEFRNPQEATNALGFDGIVFQNNALKIRRPKDFVQTDSSGDQPAPHVPGVVSTNVPDTVNKIFIGGLPSYLNDEQVMELLSSFGELRAFNLVKEGGTGASKGFAFCEYVDPNITEVACQGLNGMELGDRYLVVQRAALGANPLKQGPPGSGIGFDQQVLANLNGPGYLQQFQQQQGGGPGGPGGPGQFPGGPGMGMGMGMGGQPPASILAGQSGEGEPTRVLQILNMVAIEELCSDQDYEEILEDVKEECTKFGKVEEVRIPRPVRTTQGRVDVKLSEKVKDLGKVFVLFEKKEETTVALKAIAGRQFGGRLCICAYASEEIFLE